MKKGTRTRLLFVALGAVLALVLVAVVPRAVGHHDAATSRSAADGACSQETESEGEPDADAGEGACPASEGEREGEEADAEAGPEDGLLAERTVKGGAPLSARLRAAAQAKVVAAQTRAQAPKVAA